MFTGLVRTQGTIRSITTRGDTVMAIEADEKLPLTLGASICCHGMCLTVTQLDGKNFEVSLSAETLRCTNAGSWQVGTRINLEPSLTVGDEIGGHFVSGHVDAIAKIIRSEKSGDSTIWEFEVPSQLSKFIAPKGSITIDGVSLTVNSVSGNRFAVNIIPHTQTVTGFGALKIGDSVNIEVDMLARYVARLKECA